MEFSMIKTFWTKPEIQEKFSHCADLKQVIQSLESEFLGHGEVVCEIKVNGMVLKEEDESKFADSKLSEINELVVSTNAPQTLIRQALDSVIEYLPRAQEGSIDCSEIYRMGKLVEAQSFFHDLVEGCFWVLDTVIHMRGAHVNTFPEQEMPEQWQELELRLSKDLKEALLAAEKQDYVLLADLVEYEISTDMELIYTMLKEYRDKGLVA